MRHIGQELGLVLRSKRKLTGLFFQSAAGLLDFLVLAFHFSVLLGQLLRLLRELLVGLLQFLLAGLQLRGKLLRLLEQALSLHRGFNGVKHNADARSELLKKRQMRRGKRVQSGQFNDCLDAVFK